MIELKKCDDCDCFLIPIEMDDSNIFYHPKIKGDCKYEHLYKSFMIGVNVVDGLKFEKYIKQFKADYKIEELMQSYEDLLEESKKGIWYYIKKKIFKKKV